MTRHRCPGWQALALAALVSCASCLGPNHATGQLFNWNAGFDNEFVQAGTFLVLSPVYLAFFFADNAVFNPILWWTGTNPIAEPEGIDDLGFVRVSSEPFQGGTR